MRTSNYQITTAKVDSPEIAILRGQVQLANSDLKRLYELQCKEWVQDPLKTDRWGRCMDVYDNHRPRQQRLRIRVRGRLGPNSPHAPLYSKGGLFWRASSQDIRPEHASRFDVYVNVITVWK